MRLRRKILIALASIVVIFSTGVAALLYLVFHRAEGDYFDSNGARIFYTVEGNGPPVILVHGLAAHADLNWRRPGVTRMLAQNFQVIAFDLRGHGLSAKPSDPADYGIEMVEDITRLMDHLNIERAHVVGYSLGGFIALKGLTLHPDRFYSAAVCAAGWVDPEHPEPIPNPYRAPEIAGHTQVQQASVVGFPFAAQKSLFHRVRSYFGDLLMDGAVLKAMNLRFEELGVPREALEHNQTPLLCLIGTKDGLLPLARELASVAANVEAHEVQDANHFNSLLNQEYKQHLIEFLKQHSGLQEFSK